jgi:transglutaminase-like putative cysteine protease
MTDGYTVAHLLPRDTPLQAVTNARVTIDPEPSEIDEFTDLFGNRVVQFGVHRPHDSLVVEATSEVTLTEPGEFSAGDPWEQVVTTIDGLRDEDALVVGPFRGRSQFIDLDQFREQLSALTFGAFAPGRGIIDATRELCTLIFNGFVFDPTATDVSTPLGNVLGDRRGVCQDFAHLATGCLRSLGLAARYVSGYLETEPPPGEPRLVGADMSHAWCSVWTPSDGWIDFDPTNDHLPVRRHVTVGWGRDFADVSPVRGVVIGPTSGQSLDVSVDIAPM